MLSAFMLFLSSVVVALLAGPDPAIAAITSSLQSILRNTHGSSDYGYPTDITRDILPVGHDESALTGSRTLESLYINPILDILERQNPESPFITSPTKNGVWDTVPDQTLYFFIDVKTSGSETFEAVIAALQPLREKGYLTTVKDGKTVTNGPVTVIGTGETPFDMVAPIKDRDYFFDAPLANLNDPQYAGVTGVISPVASTDFQKAVGKITVDTDPILSDDQLKALRDQIATANERGIGARYWNTPYFPIRTRNLVWRTLLREGVILLNADDLPAAAAYF
ncbi:uncharacterized protein PGRI_060620 [Penicillium griseofulvum]|uniref:Altered inheritance of mitochondria protein 6 n=1 Tax=Penicillium patulum TaxID=5078 RepID=A0A135LMB0_PENPA|nr:uncharacterized protein PGRI_060620 [Penicillium griseofulvum]KXG50095.1 hypothetical protein PGRI_060620 [Penicillium griseofulvum]